MLPLLLLKTAQGHPAVSDCCSDLPRACRSAQLTVRLYMQLVELKSGETYNGHMVQCDSWMNVHLREVICTSKVSSAVQCSKGAHMEA